MKTLLMPLSLLGLILAGYGLKAQDPASNKTPTSLDEQTPPFAPVSSGDPQSDRTQNPATTTPPVPAAGDPLFAPVAKAGTPQSFREKLMDYAVVTMGPRALFTPAFTAGIRMANPSKAYPRDWRLGAEAFGRNYGNALASRSAMETGRFLTSAVLHEDFRYRPSTSKNPIARSFHALSYTFFDKSDSGHTRIALANFVGAGSEGFIGNLYLPPGFNNLSHAETRMAIAFGGLAGQNLLREFAPELLKATHKLHLPFPRIPVPEWWVKLPNH